MSWISSGHNFSQVWPGEVGGTNPQGHQAPESSLEKGGSLGRPNKVRRRNFIALPCCLSRIIMIEVEEPEVQPGRDLNRVKTPSASRTHWFRWRSQEINFSLFPLFLLFFFHRSLSPFSAFPPPECSRQEGWLYVKPTLPHPISKQGQMNHIVNAHRVSQTSLEVKQIAFALWSLGHPKENKQNQTNKSLFQVPISNGNVKWVFVYRNGDFFKKKCLKIRIHSLPHQHSV